MATGSQSVLPLSMTRKSQIDNGTTVDGILGKYDSTNGDVATLMNAGNYDQVASQKSLQSLDVNYPTGNNNASRKMNNYLNE